ncbi:unnamed protein product [Cochlearia groenlandica]
MNINDSPLRPSSDEACLLLSLPEDVFAVICRFLSPREVFNLILSCKSLCDIVDSEKVWLVQCEVVKALPLLELVQWRIGISSYKSLCRFLVDVVKPLVGVWVHQNPELGNVVYVMSGFLSVVGCRIIPQEIGSLGFKESQILWSPVFEILCGFDGETEFFLHGRDGEQSCVYPGFVMGIDKSCNVLSLEVEPRREKSEIENVLMGKKDDVRFPFCKLAFSHRRKLLDIVTARVGLHVPESASGMLFPMSKDDKNNAVLLVERRTMLLKMHKFGVTWDHMSLEDELCYGANQIDVNELWKNLGYDIEDDDQIQDTQRQSLGEYFKSGIKRVLRRSNTSKNTSSSKHLNLQNFLSSGDLVGLSVKASKTKFSLYRGWPKMDETHFALYKLPIKKPVEGQEYAGLWGGSFGWPHEQCTEEKSSKALFLLRLTYEESSQDDNERVLIGTKILEGTHYVMRPNGSAMFVVKIGSPSSEIFPFDTNGEDFACSYEGEGISEGYGFRYPGSKPGTLFATAKEDLLVFVWKETSDVLTLQRLDLDEILKKGLCVPPLSPCLNFAYLTRSYTNVYTPGPRTW